jgi:hypothetical protein
MIAKNFGIKLYYMYFYYSQARFLSKKIQNYYKIKHIYSHQVMNT